MAVYDGVVLRHYAFAGHWFKINITTDLSGRPTETGDGSGRGLDAGVSCPHAPDLNVLTLRR